MVKVEMKNLQVGMMGLLEAKDKEIEQLRHDLQHAQVRVHIIHGHLLLYNLIHMHI